MDYPFINDFYIEKSSSSGVVVSCGGCSESSAKGANAVGGVERILRPRYSERDERLFQFRSE